MAERYTNTLYGDHVCQRWFPDPKILVGGSILNKEDFEHLQRDFGVTAVLNVEQEHTDVGKVVGVPLCELPTQDDGQPKPTEWWFAGIGFSAPLLLDSSSNVLYIHCQMGGSRSPAMAYGCIRAILGLSQEDALRRLHRGVPSYGTHQGHWNYMNSCESALLLLNTLKGLSTAWRIY